MRGETREGKHEEGNTRREKGRIGKRGARI